MNKANPTGAYQKVECEECFERLNFVLQDNYHEFTLGFSKVLELLAVAQQVGEIPELSPQWWNYVCAIHNAELPTIENFD